VVAVVAPVATPATRDPSSLAAVVAALVAPSGATVGVSVAELGGSLPLSWSSNGAAVFTAASTYKLAALMIEAQGIAAGTTDPNGLVYFEESDYEDGVFGDYTVGAAYTRSELAYRAAHYSDNTAGHMLVRDIGGSGALNAWAAALGATGSSFFDGNTTTASDLSALWVAEADGRLGGASAQAWLYPLLTNTAYESGIPAGTANAIVVHKTGALDLTENDTALVLGLPSGAYVVTVLTDGLDEAEGTALIAAIAAAVEKFETAR
jgi:beta-lactamase class A